MRKRTIVLVLVALLVGLLAFVSTLYVPTRTFQNPEWLQSQETGLTRVEPASVVKAMVQRARIEHFFFPAMQGRRILFFDRALKVPPHDVYLIFGLQNRADSVVVYRGDLENGRLFWKAGNSRSP